MFSFKMYGLQLNDMIYGPVLPVSCLAIINPYDSLYVAGRAGFSPG